MNTQLMQYEQVSYCFTMNCNKMKKGRYIHRVVIPNSDQVVYVNLFNNAYLTIQADKVWAFDDALSNPNSDNITTFSAGVREILFNLGFLIDSNFDEMADLQKRFIEEKSDMKNLALGIVLTKACNFRCIYCNQEHTSDSFSDDDASRVIEYIKKSLYGVKSFNITWWGGEPLLKISMIEQISNQLISLCHKNNTNYNAFISTNGSLINLNIAERMLACQINNIQISIDGPAKWHNKQRPTLSKKDSYKLVLNGISNLVKTYNTERRFITIRIQLTRQMEIEINEWVKLFNDLQSYKNNIILHLVPVHETFRFDIHDTISTNEMESQYIKVIELGLQNGFVFADQSILGRNSLMYCGAIPDRGWFVLPGARITKCNNTFDDPNNDCGKIMPNGNLTLFSQAQKWIEFSPFTLDKCRHCSVLPVCMGGCNIVDYNHASGGRCSIKEKIKRVILQDPRRVTIPVNKCTNCCNFINN